MIDTIRNALQQGLAPDHLDVADESHMHSRGQNTHYKATIVSDTFQGLSPVRRHQAVYAALGELMGRFHALALHTYTAQEWAQRADQAPDSPRCEGGSRFD
ncbi:MAG: BolA family transcriptional regulator [Xanthomonadales bacterium]|nr:BolA family transcriptional regulator [Xanthomonadales bacterium]